MGDSTGGQLTTPDGRVRTHHVYTASSVKAGAADDPADLLVIALHGGGQSGTEFEADTDLDGWAEANHAVVVYPDGTGSGAQGDVERTWNGGGCCGVAASTQVDDITYMRLLIDQLVADYHVDPGHVVAIGYSNGGMLAYRLACELAASVSAIGVQSSAFERQTCSPTRSVSVLHIHGTDDHNLPIDGGVGSESSADITFLSPRTGVQTLASAESCAPQATEVTDPDNPDVLTRTWAPCSGAAVVAMKEVAGTSHAWMGSVNRDGNPYGGLDTSAVLWQFVASHLR